MTMVEVFKTNIEDQAVGRKLSDQIMTVRPNYTINFDLQDCDHILRVESPDAVSTCLIIAIVYSNGFTASVLEDVVDELAVEAVGQRMD